MKTRILFVGIALALAGCVTTPILDPTGTPAAARPAPTVTESAQIQQCIEDAMARYRSSGTTHGGELFPPFVEEASCTKVVMLVHEGEGAEQVRARISTRCTPGITVGGDTWQEDSRVAIVREGSSWKVVSRELVRQITGEVGFDCDAARPTAFSEALISPTPTEVRPLGAMPTAGPTETPAFWPAGMPSPTRRPSAVPLQPIDEASCQLAGGRWSGGIHWEPMCLEFPTTDAGQPCSDSTECQGWCDPKLDTPGAMLAKLPAGISLRMTGVCSGEAGMPPDDMLYCLQDGELTQMLMSHCEW